MAGSTGVPDGLVVRVPDPRIMSVEAWRRELESARARGARVVCATPGASRTSPDTSTHNLVLQWPVLVPSLDGGEVAENLELVVGFHEAYPWLPASVRAPQAPVWLRRHLNPVSGALCLTGHGAPGLDGSLRAVDHDPTVTMAELIARQLPRVVEANFTTDEAVPAGLEDPVGDALALYRPVSEPVLLLDFDSLGLNDASSSADRFRGRLVLARRLEPNVPFRWLGVCAGLSSEPQRFRVPESFLEDVRDPSAGSIATGDVLKLRVGVLPVLVASLQVGVSTSPEEIWSAALADDPTRAESVWTLAQTSAQLAFKQGTFAAAIVVVRDEVGHRSSGWSPLLLWWSRKDRRRRWEAEMGSVYDASRRTMLARGPHSRPEAAPR